jgi:hypothetical protein
VNNYVELEGLKEAQESLGLLPAQLMRAAKRTYSKGALFARSHLVKEIAPRMPMLQKNLRKARGRIFKDASDASIYGKAWVGVNDIPAGYLSGTPRKVSGGVQLGGRFFPNSYLMTFKSGHVGIFHREGGQVIETTVPVEQSTTVRDLVARQTTERMADIFQQEIRYELSKAQP